MSDTTKVEWDWNAFLAKDEHARESWIQAMAQSEDWPTCACGQLCAKLPRDQEGRPRDRKLAFLGMGFCEHILNMEITEAREVFSQIESRTAELLKEMGK